jgi:AraC-like DNA-binding protein
MKRNILAPIVPTSRYPIRYFVVLRMPDLAFEHIICFGARQAIVDIHYHQCFQLVISLCAPFDCTIGTNNYSQLKGFLINQGVTHSCRAQATEVLVYFIDADSYQGWQLKTMLNGQDFIPIQTLLPIEELTDMSAAYTQTASPVELRKLAIALMEKILPSQAAAHHRQKDDRMTKALAYIDAHLDDPLALEDVSKEVFLSTERLRHLFAQETGIPFSQYILWRRIKLVMTEVINKRTPMSVSAIQNGFTDQAHFTRLFKRTFGVSATQLLKNGRSIQFLSPQLLAGQ